MTASASAPIGPDIEPEPLQWQPRATWVTARLLCGASSFFFASFVFAYFYLRSLDTNGNWKIGPVKPSLGLGIAIAVLLVASAVLMRQATRTPAHALRAAAAALALALATVVLQVIEWTTLGFGPASGGYASVYIGWTAMYAVSTLLGAYWLETQVATVWRARREGPGPAGPQIVAVNLKACSFFWSFFVALGALEFLVLYVV
jgi:heme/copper-type cytochrome/quinol oxidase subunit 3